MWKVSIIFQELQNMTEATGSFQYWDFKNAQKVPRRKNKHGELHITGKKDLESIMMLLNYDAAKNFFILIQAEFF